MCTVDGPYGTLIDEFVRQELSDYNVTVVHLGDALEELALSFCNSIGKDLTLHYNAVFQRCDLQVAHHREEIYYGTRFEYNLSVMYFETRYTLPVIGFVGLYTGNARDGNLEAVLCIR